MYLNDNLRYFFFVFNFFRRNLKRQSKQLNTNRKISENNLKRKRGLKKSIKIKK